MENNITTGVPLTAKGQRFELHNSVQDKLCLLPDGQLLISKSHKTDPDVTSLEFRLKNVNFDYKIVYVDYQTIIDAYSSTKIVERVSSETQEYALRLYKDAVKKHASDIHIRVGPQATEIWYGIYDDMLFQKSESLDFGKRLCIAIYMGMTDFASAATFEMLSGQSARISNRAKLPDGVDGIRIGTRPLTGGLLMTLRVLYNDVNGPQDLESLGLSAAVIKNLRYASHKPIGLNFVCGPTGSGKSTTLHRLLSLKMLECNNREHLVTIEMPVEYSIVGAVQTESKATSEALQEALSQVMRVAPKIILVGEINSEATAAAAFAAAMTGHQVWTTLHSNGVFPTFSRLIDLKLSPDLLYDADNVTSITCQRLVKLLCPKCKRPLKDHEKEFEQDEIETVRAVLPKYDVFVAGPGCKHCDNRGNMGRTIVAENVVTTRQLMRILRTSDRMTAYDYWVKEMRGVPILRHTLEKVAHGLVDPFEARRVVGPLDAVFEN